MTEAGITPATKAFFMDAGSNPKAKPRGLMIERVVSRTNQCLLSQECNSGVDPFRPILGNNLIDI